MFVRYFLLALGVIFVLMGGVVLYAWYGQSGTANNAADSHVEPRILVLAAAHPIAKGALLRLDDLKSKELTAGEVLQPGNLTPGQETGLLGALSRRDFAEGDALLASEFIKPGDRSFLASLLKPGFRAITIAVDEAQSVAGLALPGDFVDVILIQSFDDKLTSDPRRRTAGETMLHSVRVIAVDQAMSALLGGPTNAGAAVNTQAHAPRTITLEVDERQAEKLLVAAKLGSFQLSLLPLEVAAVVAPVDNRVAQPTWASDVSLALDEISQPQPQPKAQPLLQPLSKTKPAVPPRSSCPPSTGSPLEKSVRCAPSAFTSDHAPETGASPEASQSPAREQPKTMRYAPAAPQGGGAND